MLVSGSMKEVSGDGAGVEMMEMMEGEGTVTALMAYLELTGTCRRCLSCFIPSIRFLPGIF